MIGVDVGGTFTDVVEVGPEGLTSRKVPTSADQSVGVASAVSGDASDVFMHGTTAATNALLEERGGRVGLVTDRGYEDVIEIARQDRPSLYDSHVDRPEPLVERSARVGYDGDVEATIRRLAEISPEAVAVSLIDSYSDPELERELARRLAASTDAAVLASADVSPEFREYERVATTALSAYLTPSVSDYLSNLDSRLDIGSKLIMTSSGGLIPFASGRSSAGRLVLSGPAGGVVAAAAVGAHHGYDSVLSFDMGGTSTDVSRIEDGTVTVGTGHTVAGRVNRVPSVPIRTIGAGGGSVGWVDSGGALRVGPRSAGSIPGPACYRRGGTEPTVTDANFLLGHIPDDLALGGSVALDKRLAADAMETIGGVLGMGAVAVAEGMIEVVDSHMEHALRAVSVEEGADPRRAVLVAFGGAGGLHASRLARRLGMGKVLIPPLSGVFSALGLLLAPRRTDRARTLMLDEGASVLAERISEIRTEASTGFRSVFGAEPEQVTQSADLRYFGQSHELEVEAGSWAEVRRRFEELHERRFGFRRPEEPVELVNVRAVASSAPPLTWADLEYRVASPSPVGRDGIWRRETLPPGFTVAGPASIVEDNSATLLVDGDVLTVLPDGSLEIDCV